MPLVQSCFSFLNEPMAPFMVIGWLLLVIGVSVVYRLKKGKALYPRVPVDAIFSESWASGCSNANFLVKMGGARNCLMVAVTPQEVVIVPRFPFNMMFLPELYGLEFRGPVSNICSLSEQSWFFVKMLRLDAVTASGKKISISLKLKRPDEFMAALASAGFHAH